MPLTTRQAGLLFLLVTTVGWGLNWPALKFLLTQLPPLAARGTAGMTAALGLALLARMTRQNLAVPRELWGRLVLAAMLNVFAWMGLTTVALQWLSAGEGALLVYTMPIWATLLAWPLRGERPTPLDVVALALAVAGMAVLFGGQASALDAGRMTGVLLAMSAAFLFALGTVAQRTALPLPPLTTVAWQVGIGCLPMLVLAVVFEHPSADALSAAGWSLLAYMTVIPMGVCYLSWFAALRRLPAATASTATLLTPVIGFVSAAWLLGEPLGSKQLFALGLTLGGVALALRCK